jgi:hypothetical protein
MPCASRSTTRRPSSSCSCASGCSPSWAPPSGASSFDSGPALTEKRMNLLPESSSFMDSTTSVKMVVGSLTTTSEMGVPSVWAASVPITSTQEGLTQRMEPSRFRSTITLRVCSAASLRSSLSFSLWCWLRDLSMTPAVWARSEVTAGGASCDRSVSIGGLVQRTDPTWTSSSVCSFWGQCEVGSGQFGGRTVQGASRDVSRLLPWRQTRRW